MAFNSNKINASTTGVVTGSLNVTGVVISPSFTGSLFGTASQAVSASYARSSSYNISNEGLPKYFITPTDEYFIKTGLEANLDVMYNYGLIHINSASVSLPLGNEFITNEGKLYVNELYNISTINNAGTITIGTI